jgi:uncharacterized protein
MTSFNRAAFIGLSLTLCTIPAIAQEKPVGNDIPATFTAPAPPAHEPTLKPEADYIKRVEMIPMRDGVKLYTVIVIPKGAINAPIMMTRTCYNAAARASANRNLAGAGAPAPTPAAPHSPELQPQEADATPHRPLPRSA